MKKVILIGLICGLVLVGCSEPEVIEAETTTAVEDVEKWYAITEAEGSVESETESEVVVETETEVEVITEVEDPYFGLTAAEVECIVSRLNEWKIECYDASDFMHMACLGYGVNYMTESGVPEVNYDIINYGVTLKDDGFVSVVYIETKVLAERGVDVVERGSHCPLFDKGE